MTDTLYTFKEICDQAGIPYSTGRFYRDKHPDFMYSVGTGRNKRYTNVTAEVLHFIGNAYKTGASATEVQQRLSQSYPVNQAEEQEVSQCSVTMQRNQESVISNAIAPLALIAKHISDQQQAFMEILEGFKESNTEALERATNRDMEVAYLKAEMERLKRELQGVKTEQEKHWWQKVFRKSDKTETKRD